MSAAYPGVPFEEAARRFSDASGMARSRGVMASGSILSDKLKAAELARAHKQGRCGPDCLACPAGVKGLDDAQQ